MQACLFIARKIASYRPLNFAKACWYRQILVSDPRFNSNSNRVKNRDALSALIEDVFAHHSRDALSDLLSKTGIASGQVSTMDDLMHHPQTRYVEVDTPTGPVRLLAPGALINGEIPQYGPVPALGQHSQALREEFRKI